MNGIRIKRKRFALKVISDNLLHLVGPLGESAVNLNFRLIQDKLYFATKAAANGFLGTLKSLIRGLRLGHFVEIRTEGVGFKFFRFFQSPDTLCLSLGHSCDIFYRFHKDITFRAMKYRLLLFSPFKAVLTQTAIRIRGYRPPDPYKGKGLKYATEVLKFKPGKQRQR